jgi:glutaredoxin
MKSPAVVVYSRAGCHLCDDVCALLSRFAIDPKVVDIDRDPALKAQFDVWVPVVEIDGRLRFKGRVDPLLLARLLLAEYGLEPAPLRPT